MLLNTEPTVRPDADQISKVCMSHILASCFISPCRFRSLKMLALWRCSTWTPSCRETTWRSHSSSKDCLKWYPSFQRWINCILFTCSLRLKFSVYASNVSYHLWCPNQATTTWFHLFFQTFSKLQRARRSRSMLNTYCPASFLSSRSPTPSKYSWRRTFFEKLYFYYYLRSRLFSYKTWTYCWVRRHRPISGIMSCRWFTVHWNVGYLKSRFDLKCQGFA